MCIYMEEEEINIAFIQACKKFLLKCVTVISSSLKCHHLGTFLSINKLIGYQATIY